MFSEATATPLAGHLEAVLIRAEVGRLPGDPAQGFVDNADGAVGRVGRRDGTVLAAPACSPRPCSRHRAIVDALALVHVGAHWKYSWRTSVPLCSRGDPVSRFIPVELWCEAIRLTSSTSCGHLHPGSACDPSSV